MLKNSSKIKYNSVHSNSNNQDYNLRETTASLNMYKKLQMKNC